MISREQRENELIKSGLFNAIKNLYKNTPHNIPDKYFMLMADYIDSLDEVKDDLYINPLELAKDLPKSVTSITEQNNLGIYGITEGQSITMNGNLDYNTNKLYFFHELTHALQTRGNKCSFANERNGMFLVEGATQYTAEILYHVSDGTNINYRNQYNTVRGHPEHTCYSPLSEYQINGSILFSLGQALDIPMNKMISLGYRENAREELKRKFESIEHNAGKFEEFMQDLEHIYAIDKCLIAGYSNQLRGDPVNIRMTNGETFKGSIQTQGELIKKVERTLAASYIENHNSAYVLKNYEKFARTLTTPDLKEQFLKAVSVIKNIDRHPSK